MRDVPNDNASACTAEARINSLSPPSSTSACYWAGA